MIKATAAIGFAPVVRTIAPPSVEFLWLRRKHAHGVDPISGAARGREFLALYRRVRHDLDHLLVAPDIVFERRHVEIADEDGAFRSIRPQSGMRAHFLEKRKLVLEFRIDVGVRLVTAG